MKSFESVIAKVVILLSVISFCLAALLPVYTDEITWTAILGRLNYDQGKSLTITLQPTCTGAYATKVAAVFWPARWIDTWLFEPLSTPMRLRAWGILLAIVWLLITWRLLIRIISVDARPAVAPMLLAWSTLGIMPFLLVLSRPEQILLIGTTVLLLLGIRPRVTHRSVSGDVAIASSTLAGCGFLFSAHPCGIFAAPLACLFAYRRVLRVHLRWLLIVALTFLGLSILDAWQPLWSCGADPAFARLLALSNFGTAHALHLDREFLGHLFSTLRTPAGWFVKEFTPKSEYASNMVPPFALHHARILRYSIEGMVLFALSMAAIYTARSIREVWRNRSEISLLLTLLSTWLIYFIHVFVRVQKNEYEAAYIEPLMGLLIFASFWLFFHYNQENGRSKDKTIYHFASVTGIVFLILSATSQICLVATYAPATKLWLKGGQPRGQLYSVSIANYDALASRVVATAQMCAIDPNSPQHRLVVDESTYFVFRKSNEPLFAAYFDDRGWGYYRPDPTPLFRSLASTGMVVNCNRMPRIYNGVAQRKGDLCCVPSFSSK